ncbi:MAG: heme ABC exporter ATP-binding protein CcmA [Alphaproteobacteria bacterium]
MDGFTGTDLACIRSERIVFAGLGFSVAPGDALVLSGPNGSGKSSLLRLMAGISRPAAGEITWQGTSIADDPERYFADMHYVGHRDAVKPALSVRENLVFHCALRTAPPDIDRALDLTGLAALADLPARMLSAGQTRRLALARMLASPAPLWLLDEPTVALDTRSVDRLRTAIADHRRGGGIVVASTNVPLGIDDAASIDISNFARDDETLWGDTVGDRPASGESAAGDSP